MAWSPHSTGEDIRPEARAVVKQLTDDGVLCTCYRAITRHRLRAWQSWRNFQRKSTCSPDDKLNFLRNLQASGHKVAMVGDGLNDGPVLAGANVSFAFGQAVPLAQAQADFVVLGDNLMNVVQTLKLARRTLAIVRQNLWWALIYNAACIPLAVVGLLPAWLAGLGMAASSLLVVLNALRLARGVQTLLLGHSRNLMTSSICSFRVSGFGFSFGLWWAIDQGQFEDIEGEGERILKDS